MQVCNKHLASRSQKATAKSANWNNKDKKNVNKKAAKSVSVSTASRSAMETWSEGGGNHRKQQKKNLKIVTISETWRLKFLKALV